MATEQTEAIVLRLIEFSETSLIATLYSRDLGRISAIAKGARRPKSPFDGALDLLAVCRIVVICKSSDALDLLTEAKLQRRFRAASRSLLRLNCGYYVAEVLRLWTDSGATASHPLYDLTLRTIAAIDGTEDPLFAVLRFELTGLRILGHAPATRDCVGCGTRVDTAAARIPFAYHMGGVLCPACRPRQREVASIRREVLQACTRLQDATGGPVEGVGENLYRDLRAVVSRCVCTHLGAVPRTQSLLPTKWVSH